MAGKGRGKLASQKKEVKKLVGQKVKLFSWSPLEFFCRGCNKKLGKVNTMVVFHSGEYFCDHPCAEKFDV